MCAKEGVGGGKGILFFVDMQCPWKPLPSHAQFLTPPYALLHPSFTYERERLFWSAKSKAESEPTSRSIRTLEASADRRANTIGIFSISSFGNKIHASMPAEAKACRLDIVCEFEIRVDSSDLAESYPFVEQLDLFDFGLRAVADPIYEEEWGLMGLQSILSR